MEVFTHYGIGVRAYAIKRKLDGRVEFTLWPTILFIPLFPRSSWSAIYGGPVQPDGLKEDGHRFDDAIPIQRDLISHLCTATAALTALAVAVAPIAFLIHRTTGRAATPIEMTLVFASCAWPVVMVLLGEQRRRKLLNGP